MDLCESCLEITDWIAVPYGEDLAFTEYVWESRKARVFERSPRATCDFCVALYHSLGIKDDRKEGSLSIEVSVMLTEMGSAKGLYEFCRFRDCMTKKGREFALWAETGTPASEVFVTQSPVRSSHVEQVCGLVQYWLHECISRHQCQIAVCETELPCRVLQISGTKDSTTIQLVESHGMIGTYCALSHCWGTKDKLPLRTVHENYKRHTKGIALEKLPKSFQDFVLLTRGIGINYIWIDSLCIIQDDEHDWKLQAETMDVVYRNAALVVAAAGAEDSTKGLFITDRPYTRVWNIPYGPGCIQGIFNLSELPAEDPRVPLECPLRNRGWVLQEWYLARRILFCMPLRLSWKCDEMVVAEGGSWHDLRNYEHLSWYDLLESYTRKSLTYPSDRLHALRGVANHLGKTLENEYLHNFGVWKDTLHEQILWRSTEPYAESESLPIPTWSWVATGSAKSWIGALMGSIERIEALSRGLEVSASGSLGSSGYLATPSLSLDTLERDMKLPFRYEIMYIKEPEFMKMLYDDHGRFPLTEMPTYIARDQSMSKTALGLVAFDSKPLSSISYFFVARSERYFRDYSRWPNAELGGREGGTNSGKDNSHSDLDEVHSKPRGSSASSPVSNSGSEHLKLLQVPPQPAAGAQNPGADGSEVSRFGSYSHRPFEALANTMLEDILDLIETTAFVYWCLVLEPTGEGKYKRVGLAMLYPHAFESMKPEMTEFEIT